jgi:hypothetical protein
VKLKIKIKITIKEIIHKIHTVSGQWNKAVAVIAKVGGVALATVAKGKGRQQLQ